jgi:hypothetical protein
MFNRKPVSRRDFIRAGAAACVLSRGGLVRALATEPLPVPLLGVQLFIDDYLIESQSGLKRVVSQPTRHGPPIVTPDPDRVFQPYVSVLQDQQTRRFRMWYNTIIDSQSSHIGYMESENGIDWIRPHRELKDPGPISFGVAVLDEGPDFANPAERFKLAWDQNAVYTATSANGLEWTPKGTPAVKGNGDIVSLSYDPIRKRYLVICKVNSSPEDGYKGSTQNAKEGYRRLVGQTHSEDFVNWSPLKRIVAPDDKDEGVTEYYSVGNVIARGGLLIGPLKVLRDDLPCEPGGDVNGLGYTVLAWTRDGETWYREREPFLDRNPEPHSWDRAMTWGDRLLPVGNEVFLYYGGYARGHKVERFKERQIGLARFPRDRYIARVAGREVGLLRTKSVAARGSKLKVNADVRGELRMRVLDANGVTVPGFDFADCTPIHGSSIEHEIVWRKGFASLSDKPVQLEFQLKDAHLYGLEVS